MEYYCDHRRNSDCDDENLLLDDENTGELAACARCRPRKSINGFTKPILSTSEVSWIESRNGIPLVLSSTNTGTRLINSADNIDAPLLINGQAQYNDFDYAPKEEFHCHPQIITNDNNRKALKKLILVSCICFLFMITELIGGYIADSLAVMTDAAHLCSDLVGFMVSILSIWIGQKAATRTMTFGYHRAEVLGAFLSVLAVWLLAGVFSVLAIGRLLKRQFTIEVDTMLIVASIGVGVNIIMGGVLHGVCHAHSHFGHQHSENINVRAAAAHVVGDLLQSVGVLIAAIIIKIWPNAKAADPICTLLFSFIVVYATLKVARDAMKILLEASPKNSAELATLFKSISGVKHVHDIHIWSLAPGKEVIAAHLAVDQFCDRDIVLTEATELIRSKLKVISCTIQIEVFNAELVSG